MKTNQLVAVILLSASALCVAITAVVRFPDSTMGSSFIAPAAMLVAAAVIVNVRAFRRARESPFYLRSDHHQSSHYATGSDRVFDAARAAVEEIATITDNDTATATATDAEGTTITAEVRVNLSSWGEKITLTITSTPEGTLVSVHSLCSFPFQVVDWGKNRRNTGRLLSGIGDQLAQSSDTHKW